MLEIDRKREITGLERVASYHRGSRQEAGGRQGRGVGGSGEVQKATGKCGRGGKAREVTVHYRFL